MAKFAYKVQNDASEVLEGVLEAPSQDQAEAFFQEQEMQVISIKKKRDWLNLEALLTKFDTVKPDIFNFFVRQMSTLLKAGVPMLSCLQALEEEMNDKLLKKTIQGIYEEVEQGSSFSDACAKYPRVFNPLFVSMVRVGETIGELDTALLRLATLLERDYETTQKIKSALRYPMIVLSIMVVALIIAVVFIIPKFKDMFALFGSELPLPTRILLGTSYVTTHYWYFVLMVVAGAAGAIAWHYRTYAGRRFWDGFMLKVYLLGDCIRLGIFSRFSRIMGLMLKSGVDILPAFELVSQTLGNAIIADAVLKIREEVSQGNTIANQMRKSVIFPTLIIQMVNVGESTGKLDELLLQVAEHYDAELDRMVKNIEVLIEPMFIILIGVFVSILALGIFLPMWDMNSLIAQQAS